MKKSILGFYIILFTPLLALSQITGYTHKVISKPDYLIASSLADARISLLDSTSQVFLIGKCKYGCNFNIVKIDGYKNEFFALNQVRWDDGDDVTLEILLDTNDVGSVTYQNIYLYNDTLNMQSFNNIDFRIPKGKRIDLLHKGKDYAQICVSIRDNCYTGFVKNSMIAGIDFQKSTFPKCSGYGDNSVVKMKMYDDLVQGEYLIRSSLDNARETIRIEIEEDNDLLKVRVLENTTFSNGKSNSSFVTDEYSQILIYDKTYKAFLFKDYTYQFDTENTGTTKSGWSYSIEKIK